MPKGSKPPTPKQKKLISLLPQVESGQMTLKAAMLMAGYKESVSNQQSSVLGQIRSNTKMQEALKEAGFTEEYLAGGIVEGTKAKISQMPDYNARAHYYKLGAELLDAFPAKKNINADVGIEELLDEQEDSAESVEWNESPEDRET